MRNFHSTVLALVCITLLALTSCNREDSDTVNQDTIWTSYDLRYDANEDKSYAKAVFRFSNASGTRLELSDGANITFNDETVPFQTGFAFYELDMAGLIDEGTFTYNDLEGNTFSNSINIPAISFQSTLDSIARNEAFELFWDGAALEADELVSLSVEGGLKNDTQVFIENDEGAESLILATDNLMELSEGNAHFSMERIFAPYIQQATSAGGALYGRHRALDTEVYMK
ncbi:MAG: hypothetical protein ACI9RU_000739 [Litorivivens sp.]|jgi:hypothetical protein